jgi:hypothetical protein
VAEQTDIGIKALQEVLVDLAAVAAILVLMEVVYVVTAAAELVDKDFQAAQEYASTMTAKILIMVAVAAEQVARV